MTSPASTDLTSRPGRYVLGLTLVAALLLRLLVIYATRSLGLEVVDEKHYHELARSILDGRGFAWAGGTATSIRPPVYPAFLAGVWWLWGSVSLVAARVVQAVLSLAVIGLTYVIARRLFDTRVAQAAAVLCALYPPLVFANVTLLTEILFTVFFLAALVACLRFLSRPHVAWAVLAGAAFGVASLTRSVVWLLPFLLAATLPFVPGLTRRQRAVGAVALLAGHLVVIAPWAARNTRLQGVPTVIDTMGGLNLWMANSDATPSDRLWDAVHQGGPEAFAAALSAQVGSRWLSEGEKDRWGQREALKYIAAHPALTLSRGLMKVADLWGLDREFVGGLARGMYSLPTVVVIPLAMTLVLAFPAAALLACGGVVLPWGDRKGHWLAVGVVLYLCLIHGLVFGHPRYRLPVMPIVVTYAAAFLLSTPRLMLRDRWRAAGAAALGAGLVVIWLRELFVRDADRIAALIHKLSGGAW